MWEAHGSSTAITRCQLHIFDVRKAPSPERLALEGRELPFLSDFALGCLGSQVADVARLDAETPLLKDWRPFDAVVEKGCRSPSIAHPLESQN